MGMARAYQYAQFFLLIFFVPSHTVKAQTVRREFLLSITDCVHGALVSTRGGRPSFWPRFLALTQRGGSSPFWPHFLALTQFILSAHSLALDPTCVRPPCDTFSNTTRRQVPFSRT